MTTNDDAKHQTSNHNVHQWNWHNWTT